MTEQQEDLINAETAGTLDGLFYERLRRSPDLVAYLDFDKARHEWRETSWREVAGQVARWRAALAEEGFDAGDRTAIRLRNGLDWVYFDLAVLAEGLVSVPLYTEDRPDNVAYCLADAAVRLLLVQNLAQWKKLEPALEGNETLQRVLILESPADADRASAALQADQRLRATQVGYQAQPGERGREFRWRKGSCAVRAERSRRADWQWEARGCRSRPA